MTLTKRSYGLAVPALTAGISLALLGGTAHAATAGHIPHYRMPKVYGTSFQADPKHDFTRHLTPRHNGILRGRITYVRGKGVAEYVPVKWVRDRHTEGHFVGPKEGDVTAYAAPIAKDVVFLSITGCRDRGLTVKRSLGTKRCSRALLIKRAEKGARPSLIWTVRGKIVKVVEIYTP